MAIENWAILCPGESLNLELPWQRDNGGLIAVNGAVLKCRPDYWSVLDPAVFYACRRSAVRLVFQTVIWTSSGFDLMGTTLRDPSSGQKIWDDDTRALFFNFAHQYFGDLSAMMPFGRGILWQEFSFFSAIALAILKGGRNIRIYGADMAGRGYFVAGLENFKTRHTEKRWANERRWFDEIVEVSHAHGINVERVGTIYEDRQVVQA